jgi:hypothetical protein
LILLGFPLGDSRDFVAASVTRLRFGRLPRWRSAAVLFVRVGLAGRNGVTLSLPRFAIIAP